MRLHYSEELGCVKGVVARHGWANPPNLVTVGVTTFPEVAMLALTQGEYITSVSWAAKEGCMSYLSLKTNKGNEAAAGEAPADAATFTAKDGEYLAAFKGAIGNDESCSPMAALSFRWGFDDCEVAAVEAPAAVAAPTCDALFTATTGVASCVDGQVVVGFGALKKSLGVKCLAECAAPVVAAVAEPVAAPVAAPLEVVTFSGTLSKDALLAKKTKMFGGRRLAGLKMFDATAAMAQAQAKVAALKGMATGALNQGIAAATSAAEAKQAAAAQVKAAGQAKVNAAIKAVVDAKSAPAACFTVCKKEGLSLMALKASLKGL